MRVRFWPHMLIAAIISVARCDIDSADACYERFDDAIQQVGCAAKARLAEYPQNEDAAAKFLLSYHGEAPNMEVMNVFISWGIRNPDLFIRILSQDEEFSSEWFMARFVFSLVDSGQDKKFKFAFKKHRSNPHLKEIFRRLEHHPNYAN